MDDCGEEVGCLYQGITNPWWNPALFLKFSAIRFSRGIYSFSLLNSATTESDA